jgi:hypothetical protein
MPQKHHPPHAVFPLTKDFLDQTVQVWQQYSERALTREDARKIATNVLGFVQVLREWAHEDKMRCLSVKEAVALTTAFGHCRDELLSQD